MNSHCSSTQYFHYYIIEMILFRIFELFPQYLWYFVNILLTSIFELFPLSERCLLFSLLSTSLFCRFLNCILGHIMINEWLSNHIFLDNISPVMEVRHGVESSTGRNFFQQFSLEMGVFKMGSFGWSFNVKKLKIVQLNLLDSCEY